MVSIAGGWAFRTRVAYADAIAASAAVPDRGVDLTQNEAMVLVSIAYHQPVTREGVSENMITAGPRSPTAGAPFTYVTTRQFLAHFNLDTLRDLPDLEALQDAGLFSGDEGVQDATKAHGVPSFVDEGDTS